MLVLFQVLDRTDDATELIAMDGHRVMTVPELVSLHGVKRPSSELTQGEVDVGI